MYQKVKEFGKQIVGLICEYDLNSITCNCAIASILQDHPDYTVYRKDKLEPFEPVYCIGAIGDTEIYVDSNMKYTDLRILNYEGKVIEDFTGKMDISEYI